MSFRVEEKFRISQNKLLLFKKWLNDNNAEKIFPDRKIISIYLDNEEKKMYEESIEGIVPRHKLRLRYYNDNKEICSLERKITSVEGRFKTSKKVNFDKLFLIGVFDKFYGNCKPVIKIDYIRSYFKIKNFRFTIDTNINFNGINLNKIFSSIVYRTNKTIIELKCQDKDKYSPFYNQINFEKARFSKYCEGIQKVTNLNND